MVAILLTLFIVILKKLVKVLQLVYVRLFHNQTFPVSSNDLNTAESLVERGIFA